MHRARTPLDLVNINGHALHDPPCVGRTDDLISRQSHAWGAVWRPEPGLCGSLLRPRQDLVPSWLAEAIDGHVRPLANGVVAPAVRVACEHIDWELAWLTDPDLFWRGRTPVSTAPEPHYLWEASALAAQAGFRLILDVHIEPVAPSSGHRSDRTGAVAAIVVHGAGVEGELPEPAWNDLTQALTTCGSTLYEPRTDCLTAHERQLSELAPPPIPRTPTPGTRPIGSTTTPERRLVGDWPHTWWAYPQFGMRKDGCGCPAHAEQGAGTSDFGPNHGSA